jgi:hypothetical protein
VLRVLKPIRVIFERLAILVESELVPGAQFVIRTNDDRLLRLASTRRIVEIVVIKIVLYKYALVLGHKSAIIVLFV